MKYCLLSENRRQVLHFPREISWTVSIVYTSSVVSAIRLCAEYRYQCDVNSFFYCASQWNILQYASSLLSAHSACQLHLTTLQSRCELVRSVFVHDQYSKITKIQITELVYVIQICKLCWCFSTL